ncbi:MAG: hypothetical protein J7K53_13280 [Bacteroidales bacterium]|nr:hypothetical protein [Bacteroidales bacterium]
MSIEYVPYQELNFSKWDRCIDTAYNREIYAYSWFLNSVTNHWDALIENDYEKVMPLPVSSFMGKSFIYQPMMAPELGIFSSEPVHKNTINKFISLVFEKYKYAELPFNKFLETNLSFAKHKLKQSFDLDLISPYQKTFANFTNEVKRKIRFAEDSGFFISKGLVPNQMLRFHRDIKIPFPKKFNNPFYSKLRRLISLSIQNSAGESFGVYTHENNLCSFGFIIKTNDRIVLYLVASDNFGLKKNSTWFLIDHIIRVYSERNITLRFEPFKFHHINNYPKITLNYKKKSLKYQYNIFTSFGAKKYHYPVFYNKHIPWYFKQ